ncbi:MAG: FHA domain-containing protein [Archangium sp.]|nr:FHA domain-containing protein [Archangium sp.]
MGTNSHLPGEPCCGACGVAAEVERSGVPLVSERGQKLSVGQGSVLEVEVRDAGGVRQLSFPLDQPIVIGRGKQCDVVIPSGKVSREQCTLTVTNGGLEVADLGSGCGTFVNGQRVKREHLHQADQLLIADVTLRFLVR